MAKRNERRLADAFTERRMDVNSRSDIFETRAHLECQRKARGQLGDAFSHGLQAKDDVVVRARDNAHEAILRFQRQRNGAQCL